VTVDEVYQIVTYACSKNLQQGYVSPADFNLIMPQAERSYLDYLLGEYQKYQVQRPIPVVALAQTERIRTSLAPLIYGTVLNPNNITGIAPFPSDFEQVDAMWSVYGFYNIRFSQQSRLSSFYRSVIDPIQSNPVYTIKHEGFQFYPETIGQARMSYVRTPPYMVWNYALDINGVPVYDPITSKQPIWDDTDMLNIIVRALALFGVNLQFPVVMQYSNEIKGGGQ